jgi:AAA+ superfamily predicted ATPase
MAEVVAESIAARHDMNLVEGRCLSNAEVDRILESDTSLDRCALVLIGHPAETVELQQRWLMARHDLVIMRVDIVGDFVRIGLRDPRLDLLLTALRELVERFAVESSDRVARIQLREAESVSNSREPGRAPVPTPLLQASIDWIHSLLRRAIASVPSENGDVHGFALTRATVVQSLDGPLQSTSDDRYSEFRDAEEALNTALADKENPEPLSIAARAFGLKPLEFRVMALTLAPELDFRFQQCFGFLLDDLSRRVGTLGLIASLLNMTPRDLGEIRGGNLARWLVFDAPAGHRAASDEPLRIDPFLAQWLLGESDALEHDPRLYSVLRPDPWAGASLLTGSDNQTKALDLIENLQETEGSPVLVLEGPDLADWRALLEVGADAKRLHLIRVETARLAGLGPAEIHDCALRIGRIIRLADSALAVDVAQTESAEVENDALRRFMTTLYGLNCRAVLIAPDAGSIVPFLGGISFQSVKSERLGAEVRVEAMREAAARAGAPQSTENADAIAGRYPLNVAKIEQAMNLAGSRPYLKTVDEPELERFHGACRELTLQRVSNLVDRIEPVFTLDDVVLPADRKDQLNQMVDHVRLASRVLDDWNFGEKLPYGRGVTALFSGVSGTGKTMAAMGIAHRLGIAILRIDLSKVVSKFIGETEKNISRVFADAQKSGAAILIDEADALLGKRSEVKDAHDRYANIEVAYLLQCMEAFEGLAILTTNMRANLDAAFLRRLRFMIDFPKPDVEARDKIWRQCVPAGSHELDDGDFRHLARRVELTGGQIRQITLRAAFIAAADNRLIGLEDISRATHAELTKLGMPPVEIVRNESRRAA